MKNKRILFIITLMSSLALIITSLSCSDDENASVDLISKIPEDSSYFSFIDVSAMRTDDDMDDLYDEWEDNYNYLEHYGIDRDDVNRLAISSDATLCEGEFDLEEIREELEDLDYDDDEYREVEIWESADGHKWIALTEDLIIIGSEDDVKDCLWVIKDGEDSMYDDSDINDVLNKLPDGIYMSCDTEEAFEDLEASGLSYRKLDDDTIGVSAVFKFDDEDAADDAINEIEDYAENYYEDIRHVDVWQDGLFVIAEGEIDMDDF